MEAARRFLVAAGTSRYEQLGAEDQLPSVEADVLRIVKLFCGQLGYERVLAELGDSPRAGKLRDALSAWLASENRGPLDRVVVYYSGHGETGPDGRHYLLARDFDGRNYVGRALATEDVGRMLAGTPLRHVLVLLDTCYSGEGISDLGALQRVIETSRHEGDEPGAALYLVAASRRKEVAHEGAFSRLFVEAVDAPSHGGWMQSHVDPAAVIGAVNNALKTAFPGQHARLNVVGAEGGLSPLIPNPRYEPRLPDGLDVASARRLLKRPDLLAHWGPRARGVELEAEPGDFFEGRTAALRALVTWLAQDAAGGPVRVVTGRPGSGKSALLARLAVLSDSEYRARVDLRGAATGTVPPVGAIDVAVHARGKTVTDVAVELAAELGCEPTIPLVTDAAASRDRPLVVLVDALDEALEPRALARAALRPLAASGTVKLLVGTRQHVVAALAAPSEAVLDLDQPAWFDPCDVEHYVEHTLTTAAPGGVPSPYARSAKLGRKVAREVARRAGSTFLIARLVARSLAERPEAIDVSDPGWATRLPDTVGEAFEEWLDRFAADKPRVRDLLRPLAFAQGAGLPWETLWPALASAIAGRLYGDSDIEWTLETAGALIVENREEDRSVYRLFHDELARYLRPPTREAAIHKTITDTLERGVPCTDGTLNWQAAHPYIRTHLATHAAAAGILDHLLDDPGYLIAADPPRLLRALPAATDPAVAEIRRAYQHVAHLLRGADAAERAAYLEMAARQGTATTLADLIAQRQLIRPWTVSWTHWRSASGHFTAGRHDGPVNAVAVSELDGRPVIVSGGDDATLGVWDLAEGAPLGEPLRGHDGWVNAVAVGELDGRPVIVSGGVDRTVRVWGLAEGAPRGQPFTGYDSRVRAVAVSELEGRPVIVIGGNDGTVRVWDLATGAPRGQPLTGHNNEVLAVAVGELEGRPVIVAAGRDGTLWVWDLATGAPRSQPLTGHEGSVNAVAVGELDGRPVIISGGRDGTVRVWNLAEGAPRGQPLIGHTNGVMAVAVGDLDGSPVIISGGVDGTVRVWDLAEGAPRGTPLTGHDRGVWALAVGELEGRPVIVSAGYDGTVRVWDPAEGAPRGTPLTGHDRGVWALAVGELEGRPVIVSAGYDGTVRVWDPAEGAPRGQPLTGHDGWVRAVTVGELDGRPVIVSAGRDGTVRVWDLATGAPLGQPLTGHDGPVNSVAVGELEGRPVIVSGDDDGAVRVWDLASGAPLGQPLTGHDGWVNAVAVGELEGRPVVVSAGRDRTVRVWDLATGAPRGQPLTGYGSRVRAVALCELDGRPVIVFGGNDGTVRVWDLATGAPSGQPLTGHDGWVNAAAVWELKSRPVIVSGGRDGTVRVWDFAARQLCVINVRSTVRALAVPASGTIVVGADAGVMGLKLPLAAQVA